MAKNIAEDIATFLLMHRHYLHRLETGELRKLIEPYRRAKREIFNTIVRLEALPGPLNYQIHSLRMLLSEVESVLAIAAFEGSGEFERVRAQLVASEATTYYGFFAAKFARIGIQMAIIPLEHLEMLIDTPLLGETIGEKMLWGNAQAVKLMRQELSQAIIQGEGIPLAAKRLINPVSTGLTGSAERVIARRATMIARTELLDVSNKVLGAYYKENDDIIESVEYMATLDKRTCLVCAPLDGTIFKLVNGEHKGPRVPQHPQCRCIYAPRTYSWEDLGVDPAVLDDSDKSYFGRQKGKIFERRLYQDWLKDMDISNPKFVKDFLGTKRYSLWKSGKVKFNEMAKDGKVLTLKQLETKVRSFS